VTDYAEVVRRASAAGLATRGGFHPEPDDAVPTFDDGSPVATLVLLGNVGRAMWDAFSHAPEHGVPGDGLDRWSERVVGDLAEALGGRALFPFGGPPWLPFVRWAARAEPVWRSPIGPLVHAEHGLWHAYRGALALRERLELPPRPDLPRPCDTCVGRPCLEACPVGAFRPDGYDVPACVAHASSPAGRACLRGGCLARHACPVGRERAYLPAQAEHHMRAFLQARLAAAR
jgi:hypothetical protein